MTRLFALILTALTVAFAIRAYNPAYGHDNVIRIVSNPDSLLPLRRLPVKVAVVTLSDTPLTEFTDYCSRYVRTVLTHTPATTTPVIIAVDASSSKMRSRALRIIENTPHLIAVVWMGRALPHSNSSSWRLITAPDASPANQAAAAQAIFGGIDVVMPDGHTAPRSRLGFASPADVGMNESLNTRIDSVVAANIAAHSFPGCQIVVAKDGYVIHHKAYGTLSYTVGSAPVTDTTLYDIASMTKVLGTLPGIMKLYDSGDISLTDSLSQYLPRLQRPGLSDLTLADFLYHRTGLPPTINTYALLFDSTSYTKPLIKSSRRAPFTIKIDKKAYLNSNARVRSGLFADNPSASHPLHIARNFYAATSVSDGIDSAVYNAPLRSRRYLYSCLNFCILKDLEQTLTGIPHDTWITDSVYSPIGAYRTCFNPVASGAYTAADIAPTEREPAIRKQLLQGYVHDEIAAYSGGVQGNAGIFTTALDAAKLCQTWLQGGSYGNVQLFAPTTVHTFTRSVDSASSRALGFDLAERVQSWRSTGVSSATYGHTGFTGTCCWIDPVNGLVYIFLANRICPSRQNEAFSALSPREAILKIIIDSL